MYYHKTNTNHTITSIDEESIWQNLMSTPYKHSEKPRNQREFSQPGHLQKPTANIILEEKYKYNGRLWWIIPCI